jgi:hypothetical protein
VVVVDETVVVVVVGAVLVVDELVVDVVTVVGVVVVVGEFVVVVLVVGAVVVGELVVVVVVVGAVVLVDEPVVEVVVVVLVVVTSGRQRFDRCASLGFWRQSSSSTISSAALSTQVISRTTPVPSGSPGRLQHSPVEFCGQHCHQAKPAGRLPSPSGSQPLRIAASFLPAAAPILALSFASGQGPGRFPDATSSRHFSTIFSLASRNLIPAFSMST